MADVNCMLVVWENNGVAGMLTGGMGDNKLSLWGMVGAQWGRHGRLGSFQVYKRERDGEIEERRGMICFNFLSVSKFSNGMFLKNFLLVSFEFQWNECFLNEKVVFICLFFNCSW